MKTSKPRHNGFRFGYTLVEMLVSIGLVMLIMILLAQVFGLATGSMEKHRATSANDQQARTFVSVIKGDLCARSFRFVYPFQDSKSINTSGVFAPGPLFDPEKRRGYFSINENDPNSTQDDTLSFTVDFSRSNNCLYQEKSGLRGQTVILGGNSDAYLRNNPNQPEYDDGFPSINRLGLSHMAEVIYFVRHGNLYRRVMLLRDAYDNDIQGPPIDGQPSDRNDNDIITGPYPGPNSGYSPQGSGSFWRDFDYSAVFSNVPDNASGKPYFLVARANTVLDEGRNCLDNHHLTGSFSYNFGGSIGEVNDLPLSLGIPLFRFGHDINDIDTSGATTVPMGRPKEFLQAHTFNLATHDPMNPIPETVEANYMGRFLAQENSHDDFEYPGRMPASGNPHSRSNLTFAANGSINGYHDERHRRGDEILLTNVIDFDVKVWDDIARRFVDLGHSLTEADLGFPDLNGNGTTDDPDDDGVGRYHRSQNQNPAYGNIYDTWHPWQHLGPPPYRPTSVGLDGQPGQAGEDDNLDGTVDTPPPPPGPPDTESPERGWLGTDDEVPLKAIQITIRYMDPQLKLVRQVTITEHLTD